MGQASKRFLGVLIADDEAMFRAGLELILEREGFHVVATCADGVEAVNASEQLCEDVAILDRFMPNLDGPAAARAIRRVSPQTRCILLSQYDPLPSVSKLSADFAGGVHKRQAADVLIEVIRQVARGGGYWPAPYGTTTRPEMPLSGRERQVLQLLAEGFSMKEIGVALGLSVKTIEGHRSSLTSKLQIRDIPGLVRYALQSGIISEP